MNYQLSPEKKNLPATKKQLWALFCLTKKDHRDKNLTMEQASDLIGKFKKDKSNNVLNTPNNNKKHEFEELFERAEQVAKNAYDACKPTPMVVSQHVNPLNDSSPIVKSYFVEGGPCGFAHIQFKDARRNICKYMKKNNLGHYSDYSKSVSWEPSCSRMDQSLERKEAACSAAIKVFSEAGIDRIYISSRMD